MVFCSQRLRQICSKVGKKTKAEKVKGPTVGASDFEKQIQEMRSGIECERHGRDTKQ